MPLKINSEKPITTNGRANGMTADISSSGLIRRLATRAQYTAGTVRASTITVVQIASQIDDENAPRMLGDVKASIQLSRVRKSGNGPTQRPATEYSATAMIGTIR